MLRKPRGAVFSASLALRKHVVSASGDIIRLRIARYPAYRPIGRDVTGGARSGSPWRTTGAVFYGENVQRLLCHSFVSIRFSGGCSMFD